MFNKHLFNKTVKNVTHKSNILRLTQCTLEKCQGIFFLSEVIKEFSHLCCCSNQCNHILTGLFLNIEMMTFTTLR